MTEERKTKTPCWINQAKYFMIYQCYIGTQSDLTEVMTLNRKSQSSTAKLNWTKKELWIVTDSFVEQCM